MSRCRWFHRGGGFLGLPRAIGDGDDDVGSGDDGGGGCDNDISGYGDYEGVMLLVMIMIK